METNAGRTAGSDAVGIQESAQPGAEEQVALRRAWMCVSSRLAAAIIMGQGKMLLIPGIQIIDAEARAHEDALAILIQGADLPEGYDDITPVFKQVEGGSPVFQGWVEGEMPLP